MPRPLARQLICYSTAWWVEKLEKVNKHILKIIQPKVGGGKKSQMKGRDRWCLSVLDIKYFFGGGVRSGREDLKERFIQTGSRWDCRVVIWERILTSKNGEAS